jgi:hypothetical protein
MQKIISTLLSVVATTVFTVFGYSEKTIVEEPKSTIVLNNVQVERLTNTTTTTVAKFKVPKNALCPQWWDLAISVGWDKSELAKLDGIMWRESRCLPSAFNAGDPNGGSHGLMQINRFWCRKSQYSKLGFLQDAKILDRCEELHKPKIALESALEIFNYSVKYNNNGWSPWGK